MAEIAAETDEIWRSFPHDASWEALAAWTDTTLRSLAAVTREDLDPAGVVAMDLARPGATQAPFGLHADAAWRRLVAATLVADWASYPAPVDRVSFERLAFAAGVFPRGFRLWWARHATLGWLPAGYSAWHPISEAQFTTLETRASALLDRVVVPLASAEPGGFAHIFNFSVVPALRKTEASRRMLQALARDLAAARAEGLSAITVSDDGARVVRRFGLAPSGVLRLGDVEEVVFTCRSGSSANRLSPAAPLSDPGLALLDRLDRIVWIADIDDWRILWANRAAVEFWDAGDLETFMRRELRASESLRQLNFQIRERLKKERFVRMDHTVYPDARAPERLEIVHSRYDLPNGRIGIMTEASLMRVTDPETLRRLDAVRYAPLVMTTHAIDGKTLSANTLARTSFGETFDFKGLFEDEATAHALLDALARGEPVSVDCELCTLHGARWHAVEARSVTDPVTHLPAILLSAHDVTERREAERAKDEILSVVSHELRTPLTSIRGSLDLIASGAFAGDAAITQEMLDIARANAIRLHRTIDDLLEVQRLAAGAVRLSASLADLGALVKRTIELQQPAAHAAGVAIQLTRDEEGLVCSMDAARIQQVIANLLSNAIKHSAAGQVVCVELGRSGSRARVLVADQGPGVPASFRDRIFQLFAQADASDNRPTGGTGLGLYIAKTLIEKHGGEIGYDAHIARGARFHFDLPLGS